MHHSAIRELQEQLRQQEQQIADLARQVEAMREKPCACQARQPRQQAVAGENGNGKVLDWCITQGKNGDGKQYWRALRRIDGKQHSVYVGQDKALAEQKIREYCAKRGIAIEEGRDGT